MENGGKPGQNNLMTQWYQLGKDHSKYNYLSCVLGNGGGVEGGMKIKTLFH